MPLQWFLFSNSCLFNSTVTTENEDILDIGEDGDLDEDIGAVASSKENALKSAHDTSLFSQQASNDNEHTQQHDAPSPM